jgi:hypothetical protein
VHSVYVEMLNVALQSVEVYNVVCVNVCVCVYTITFVGCASEEAARVVEQEGRQALFFLMRRVVE